MTYIDKEKIKYHKLSVCEGHGLNFEYTVAYKHEVDAIPTTDVVPKSEVERLQAELDDKQFRCDSCDRIMLTGAEHRACVKQAKADVAREIFAEIENYMLDFEDITHTVNRTIGAATFALLKKKYTEGETQKCCEHC